MKGIQTMKTIIRYNGDNDNVKNHSVETLIEKGDKAVLQDVFKTLFADIELISEHITEPEPEEPKEVLTSFQGDIAKKKTDKLVNAIAKHLDKSPNYVEENFNSIIKGFIAERQALKADYEKKQKQVKKLDDLLKTLVADCNYKVGVPNVDGQDYSLTLSKCTRRSLISMSNLEKKYPKTLNVLRALGFISKSSYRSFKCIAVDNLDRIN
jgi:hypothetical protein